nr:hypothetical protein [Escherichia coli]
MSTLFGRGGLQPQRVTGWCAAWRRMKEVTRLAAHSWQSAAGKRTPLKSASLSGDKQCERPWWLLGWV